MAEPRNGNGDLSVLNMSDVALLVWVDNPDLGGTVHVHFPVGTSRREVIELLKLIQERVQIDTDVDDAVEGGS